MQAAPRRERFRAYKGVIRDQLQSFPAAECCALACLQAPSRHVLRLPNFRSPSRAWAPISSRSPSRCLKVRRTGFDAAAVIGADLERSGAFRLIPTGAEGEPENLEKPASLEAFGKLGANALAVGRVSRLPDGRWELTYYLHNTVTGALTDSAVFTTSGNDVRMCAHRIADRIYTNLTGEGPIFASKLVYVAQLARNRYELVISDSDGGNHQAALQSHEPIHLPVWSPDGKKISYVMLRGPQADHL